MIKILLRLRMLAYSYFFSENQPLNGNFSCSKNICDVTYCY